MTIDNPTTVVLAVMAGTVFGIVSIPHCIGMCGPLHLTMCLSSSKRSLKSLTLFNCGRIAGYTVIGALCGLFGSQLTHMFPAPPSAQPRSANAASVETVESGSQANITVPTSCCPPQVGPSKGEGLVGGVTGDPSLKKLEVPTSCCPPKTGGTNSETVTGGDTGDPSLKKVEVPTSCCPPKTGGTNNETVTGGDTGLPARLPAPNNPASQGDAQRSPDARTQTLGLPPLGRRLLMYIFPAAILALVGIKGLLKRPGSVGTGSAGFISILFAKLKVGGPMACGAAASLLPCGLLYIAFGIAVSTMSPLLGGIMLFFYCLTITFFLQLGIMVGTTFGRKLGPAVNKYFPYIAILAATIYIVLFIRSA